MKNIKEVMKMKKNIKELMMMKNKVVELNVRVRKVKGRKERHKHGVEYKDIAVLARTNFLPTTVISKLISAGIPVAVRDGVKLFKDSVVQDLLTAVAIASKTKPEKGWNNYVKTIRNLEHEGLPLIPEKMRANNLAAIELVDYVVMQNN